MAQVARGSTGQLTRRGGGIIYAAFAAAVAAAFAAVMNPKLLLKSLLIVVVLALLVMMGMNNTGRVDFALPPLLPRRIQMPAALMYFACFAVGFLTGTLLWAGGGKKGGAGGRSGADRK